MQEAERERQALGATKDLLDKAERQLREAFQALAAEALHANQGAFLDLAKATFDGLQERDRRADGRAPQGHRHAGASRSPIR